MKDYSDLIYGYEKKVPTPKGLERYINLDNAASTPAFKEVIEHFTNMAAWYAGVHRGTGYKSKQSTELYEAARQTVAEFVGANLAEEAVIFTKNTTDSINKVRHYLPYLNGESVIFSRMEHHSNELPWSGYPNKTIGIVNGQFNLEQLENHLKQNTGKVKLVAVCGASNVTGYTPPIYTIAEMAHRYGSKILVDGAQLVPHRPVQLFPETDPRHLDFLAFSAHKMYAPFGVGLLIGPKWLFSQGSPSQVGGGTVKALTAEGALWQAPPDNEEAGSPNVLGAAALAKACQIISQIGWTALVEHENELIEYALSCLRSLPRVIIYNSICENRVGVIAFNVEGFTHREVADFLADSYGIGVRNGCFCARRYVMELLNIDFKQLGNFSPGEVPGMVRISFGCYNQKFEIDRLCEALEELIRSK
ncbi:MAG TPA: aminotransferase class V-fold PLP-dependent enzyme [Bacillota bacterium]|nr:aminotransferase class V-fold PLP-dependent enzyme [Bacillota bacterium]